MDLTLIRSASLFYFPWGGAIAASQLLVQGDFCGGINPGPVPIN